ncbi:hypothetical protein BDA99DRAFT_542991 [Phascolomyces articulosus]|uniref:F-box domain-containing protein n=1 Tax=Phascolomyces articulosus TaxID=60185 RepID=A0AAD5P9W8_9FUNG|nr:hypothetical protein BDA99DRAFT_542991 [Phascolomyces articulosus]
MTSRKSIDELIREAQSDDIATSQFNEDLKQVTVMQRENLLQAFHKNEKQNHIRSADNNGKSTVQPISTTMANNKNAYVTKLEREIEETLQEIEKDPQNLNNYLSAVRLFSCQGNQEKVIHLCEQGLNNHRVASSPPSSLANEYLLLQQQLDMAKTKIERRIDIFGQCPYEVSHRIISYLDLATAIQGVDVARMWRKRFLGYLNIWKDFTLEDGMGKQRKITQLLSIESKIIKALYINTRPEKIRRHLSISIKKNKFANLQSLVITDTGGGKLNPDANLTKSLYNALPSIASTLTRLDIISQSVVLISLDRILLICRNLKSLKLRVYSLNHKSSLEPDEKPSLTSPLTNMEISANWPMNPQEVRYIYRETVKYTPELRRLVVYYEAKDMFDTQDMIEVIGDHCPKLKIIKTGLLTKYITPLGDIIYNVQNQDFNDDETLLLDDDGNDDINDKEIDTVTTSNNSPALADVSRIATTTTMKGLRHIDIHNMTPSQSFRARLEASCHTLQSLSICLGYQTVLFSDLHEWQFFTSFTMHQLTMFRLSKVRGPVYEQLAAILQCFPALEALVLEDSSLIPASFEIDDETINNNQILNAITTLPNLKRLEFKTMSVFSQDFFEQLIHYYQSTSTFSSGLKYLKIVDCQGFLFKAFLDISHITSLKELTLGICYQHRRRKGVDMFIEMFTNQLAYDSSRPQALSKLELLNMHFTDTAIKNVITLCQRHDMLQEKLMLYRSKEILFENVKILKEEIAPLYNEFHCSSYSDFIFTRSFTFSQKKTRL